MESGRRKFYTNTDILNESISRLGIGDTVKLCYAIAVWEKYQQLNSIGKDTANDHEYNFKWWNDKGNEMTNDIVNKLNEYANVLKS